MATPHKCPICSGRGTMPGSFYGDNGPAGLCEVTCRSCGGSGIVWDYSSPTLTIPIPVPCYDPLPHRIEWGPNSVPWLPMSGGTITCMDHSIGWN